MDLSDAFARDTELCLDERITRKNEHVVGAGGHADVYEGYFGNQKVAIKVVRWFASTGKKIGHEKLLQRLWREYLAWSRLSHPNILACLGYTYDFSADSFLLPSLVSPWMTNGTVHSYLEDHPDVDRLNLVVGIASGLNYLHTRDPVIVHGDLRAANILVSDQGVPCLADFGLSRILGSNIKGMTSSRTGTGCLRWMSPELISGGRVSGHSDIWAFGMTILEICSGEFPYYNHEQEIVVLMEILNYRIPSRPPGPRIIDDKVWVICQLCWNADPAARPPILEIISMLCLNEAIMEDAFDNVYVDVACFRSSYQVTSSSSYPPLAGAIESQAAAFNGYTDNSSALPGARQKNLGFTCPVPGCGSTFAHSYLLRVHLRSHNEDWPFKCQWPGCERGFARQHDYKRHEALHLNIRPYICLGCNKTFAHMDALYYHVRSEGSAGCAGHNQSVNMQQEQQPARSLDRDLSSRKSSRSSKQPSGQSVPSPFAVTLESPRIEEHPFPHPVYHPPIMTLPSPRSGVTTSSPDGASNVSSTIPAGPHASGLPDSTMTEGLTRTIQVDYEILAAMRTITNQQFWDDMMMPGFGWIPVESQNESIQRLPGTN